MGTSVSPWVQALVRGFLTRRRVHAITEAELVFIGRGLHSFRFQLNLSSSVQRITQLNS